MRAICPGSLHPFAQRGFGQIEIAGHRADWFAFVNHQSDGLSFEFIIELPTRAPAWRGLGHRCGHRIRLSEDVHQSGSSAVWWLGSRVFLLELIFMGGPCHVRRFSMAMVSECLCN